MKTYLELITFPTFEERFNYLKEDGVIGYETFGNQRFLNQEFYGSSDWKRVRREVITRDGGFDLGIFGLDIIGRVYVHHIDPITVDDILNRNPKVLDPNNLITMSENTHKLLHYGEEQCSFIERTPNDTCPWR